VRNPLRPVRRIRAGRDDGYVLILTTLMLVPLLVLTAFAVDLGAWYAQSSKMQRAVDNAALAAVVWMPDHTKATSAAAQVLTENGYSGSYAVTFPTERQVKVTIGRGTSQYFSKLVMSAPTLNRAATAEFNKAIPLGSPANTFGTDPGNVANPTTCNTATAGAVCSGLWGAINGPYTAHQQGDPYTTKCAGNTNYNPATCDKAVSSTYPTGAENTSYQPDGYMYAIDIPAALVGQQVTVQVYDAIAYDNTASMNNFEGDSVACYSGGGGNCTAPTFNTQFELFKSDGSDLSVSTDASLSMNNNCTAGPGKKVVSSNDPTPATYKNAWYTLCTFTPTVAGIHPLVVKSSNIPGYTDSGGGTNQFSTRATTAVATKPSVYAINDMSVYTPGANSTSNSSLFYLANISSEYAGKSLVVDLFDPGDGSCGGGCTGFTMQFRPPPGGAPAAVPASSAGSTACNYNATGSSTIGPATPNTSANCTITTLNGGSSSGIYNDKWLRVTISIPSNYTCSTDCWWTVKYNFSSGSSTDRTVWTVTLLGDPVHLVQ
jgi:Flp pilus assembly protein TadG